MRHKFYSRVAVILAAVVFSSSASFADSEIVKKFTDGFEKNDPALMSSVIEENKDKIPGEIDALLQECLKPEMTPEDREAKLYIAEVMARSYNEATGNTKPLMEVKKKSFDSKLSKPVRLTPVNGVYTVELPKASDTVKNVFVPDNIIIKKGETVRWVNKDDIAHIFSAMAAISSGRFSSTSVPPGESWEMKFEKPGEYFYLCFIHHAMIGKITVEE